MYQITIGTRFMIKEQTQSHWAFSKHLTEAIHVNKLRRQYYSIRTNGRSLLLSNLLILLEYLTYPIAYYFDWRGLAYQRRGVPLFTSEFLPMDIVSKKHSPLYTSSFGLSTRKELNQLIENFKNNINSNPTLENLKAISQCSMRLIHNIKKVQLKNTVHLSMTLHLAESIYLVASKGILHAKLCNQASIPLSMQLIQIHSIALKSAIKLDQLANRCHQQGVGILVNDLPTLQINH